MWFVLLCIGGGKNSCEMAGFLFFWLLIYCGFLVGEKRLCGFSGFNCFVLFGAKRGGICLIGAKLVPTEAGRNGASL